MVSCGYTRCEFDCCVYPRKLDDGTFIYLTLHVNDMLIAAKSKSHISDLKNMLSSEFKMKDFGAAKKILGMEINRDRKAGKLWFTQRSYVNFFLKRFSMLHAKSVKFLLAAHFQLSSEFFPTTEDEMEYMA